MPLKVSEIIRLLERDGWQLRRTRGSHRQFRHPTKPGVVTVEGDRALTYRWAPERSIFRQAGIERGRS